jgi:hypothetical protein
MENGEWRIKKAESRREKAEGRKQNGEWRIKKAESRREHLQMDQRLRVSTLAYVRAGETPCMAFLQKQLFQLIVND